MIDFSGEDKNGYLGFLGNLLENEHLETVKLYNEAGLPLESLNQAKQELDTARANVEEALQTNSSEASTLHIQFVEAFENYNQVELQALNSSKILHNDISAEI